MTKCTTCGGTGKIGYGKIRYEVATGKVLESTLKSEPCPTCQGTGKATGGDDA